MTHRRPDPQQAGLENVLRNALRLAVDSIEPAADGMDRIRGKIAARQAMRVPRWRMATVLAGLLTRLQPAGVWLRAVYGVVVERFRPEPQRAGRLGLLRPVAAVATGLFVVASASWAIAALPQVISPTNNSRGVGGGNNNGGGSAGGPGTATSGPAGSQTGYSGYPAPGGGTSPASSRTCPATSPAPSSSPSGSPSGSPSPSPSSSSSPSTSPSGSPSPSTSPSGSPSPSASASSAGPTMSPAATQPGSRSHGAASTRTSGAPTRARNTASQGC